MDVDPELAIKSPLDESDLHIGASDYGNESNGAVEVEKTTGEPHEPAAAPDILPDSKAHLGSTEADSGGAVCEPESETVADPENHSHLFVNESTPLSDIAEHDAIDETVHEMLEPLAEEAKQLVHESVHDEDVETAAGSAVDAIEAAAERYAREIVEEACEDPAKAQAVGLLAKHLYGYDEASGESSTYVYDAGHGEAIPLPTPLKMAVIAARCVAVVFLTCALLVHRSVMFCVKAPFRLARWYILFLVMLVRMPFAVASQVLRRALGVLGATSYS